MLLLLLGIAMAAGNCSCVNSTQMEKMLNQHYYNIERNVRSHVTPIYQLVDSVHKRVSILKDRVPATTNDVNASTQEILRVAASKNDIDMLQTEYQYFKLEQKANDDRLRLEVYFLLISMFIGLFIFDAFLRKRYLLKEGYRCSGTSKSHQKK